MPRISVGYESLDQAREDVLDQALRAVQDCSGDCLFRSNRPALVTALAAGTPDPGLPQAAFAAFRRALNGAQSYRATRAALTQFITEIGKTDA